MKNVVDISTIIILWGFLMGHGRAATDTTSTVTVLTQSMTEELTIRDDPMVSTTNDISVSTSTSSAPSTPYDLIFSTANDIALSTSTTSAQSTPHDLMFSTANDIALTRSTTSAQSTPHDLMFSTVNDILFSTSTTATPTTSHDLTVSTDNGISFSTSMTSAPTTPYDLMVSTADDVLLSTSTTSTPSTSHGKDLMVSTADDISLSTSTTSSPTTSHDLKVTSAISISKSTASAPKTSHDPRVSTAITHSTSTTSAPTTPYDPRVSTAITHSTSTTSAPTTPYGPKTTTATVIVTTDNASTSSTSTKANDPDEHLHIIIAGSVVAGVCFLGLLAALTVIFIYFMRIKAKARTTRTSGDAEDSSSQGHPNDVFTEPKNHDYEIPMPRTNTYEDPRMMMMMDQLSQPTESSQSDFLPNTSYVDMARGQKKKTSDVGIYLTTCNLADQETDTEDALFYENTRDSQREDSVNVSNVRNPTSLY